MKRYKIAKENLNEFWGWFGKKKPQTMQQIIDDDPILKKLDGELYDINRNYIPKIKKMKKDNPEMFNRLLKAGLINPDDLK